MRHRSILDDADIDKTVAGLKSAGLMNNGQACVAQTQILVSDRRHDDVVDALAGMKIVSGVSTRTYGINMYTLDIGAPFGGFKQSGIGREFGPEGLHK